MIKYTKFTVNFVKSQLHRNLTAHFLNINFKQMSNRLEFVEFTKYHKVTHLVFVCLLFAFFFHSQKSIVYSQLHKWTENEDHQLISLISNYLMNRIDSLEMVRAFELNFYLKQWPSICGNSQWTQYFTRLFKKEWKIVWIKMKCI